MTLLCVYFQYCLPCFITFVYVSEDYSASPPFFSLHREERVFRLLLTGSQTNVVGGELTPSGHVALLQVNVNSHLKCKLSIINDNLFISLMSYTKIN